MCENPLKTIKEGSEEEMKIITIKEVGDRSEVLNAEREKIISYKRSQSDFRLSH